MFQANCKLKRLEPTEMGWKSESDNQETSINSNLRGPTNTDLHRRTQKNKVSWSTRPTSAKFGSWCWRLYSASSNAMLRIYKFISDKSLRENECIYPTEPVVAQNHSFPEPTQSMCNAEDINRVLKWRTSTGEVAHYSRSYPDILGS